MCVTCAACVDAIYIHASTKNFYGKSLNEPEAPFTQARSTWGPPTSNPQQHSCDRTHSLACFYVDVGDVKTQFLYFVIG